MSIAEQRRTFISYSRKDKEFALEFARELKSAGLDVWLDQLDIPTGVRWDDAVERALRECDIFLIILTRDSVSSENVKDEIGFAIDHGKRIMPVLLEECDVPLRLRRFQYVDFTKTKFSDGVKRAKQLLENLLGGQPVPIPTETPPKTQLALKTEIATAPSLPAQNKSLLDRRRLGIAGVFVFVSLIGILGVAFIFRNSIFPSFASESQIILEPDYSLVSTVRSRDLEEAAQILTARSEALGLGITFVVAQNNQITARVPTSSLSQDLIGDTIAIGLLEIVDLGETPIQPGTTIATDYDYQYFPEVGGTKWTTVLTNLEFESASVEQNNVGEYQIAFKLTAHGTQIFANYTTNNVGHYLGIVVDKVVISAPMLNAPITNGIGIIVGNLTQNEANTIATYLRVNGPLPIPLVIKQVSEDGNR